jgi:hypothetical protein
VETITPGDVRGVSTLFVGQWEKEDVERYSDLWYLVKQGVPTELRAGLWLDLLKK